MIVEIHQPWCSKVQPSNIPLPCDCERNPVDVTDELTKQLVALLRQPGMTVEGWGLPV